MKHDNYLDNYRICDVLFANYGINVNTDFNRTIKVVDEWHENLGNIKYPHSKGKNPYWGNKEYNEPGFLRGDPTIIDDDIGDTVSIIYSFRIVGFPWALKDEFYYEIAVKSDAEVLMLHRGIVATVDIPKKGLFLDSEGVWNDVTTYAEKIPEALARDIKAMTMK